MARTPNTPAYQAVQSETPSSTDVAHLLSTVRMDSREVVTLAIEYASAFVANNPTRIDEIPGVMQTAVGAVIASIQQLPAEGLVFTGPGVAQQAMTAIAAQRSLTGQAAPAIAAAPQRSVAMLVAGADHVAAQAAPEEEASPLRINKPQVVSKTYKGPVIEVDGKMVAQKPAVDPAESIFEDYIICLEDGRRMKTLKKHLKAKFNMTPDEYRAKWGLPENYPMACPSFSRTRSELARKNSDKLRVSREVARSRARATA